MDVGEVRWFRNWHVYTIVGATILFQLVVIIIIFQFASTTKMAINRVLNLVLLCMTVAYITILIAILIHMYPVQHGLSNEGIHLKFLGRKEIVYWETIKSIKRVEPWTGSTIIMKSSGSKQNLGLVGDSLYSEMNEELKKHRFKTTR